MKKAMKDVFKNFVAGVLVFMLVITMAIVVFGLVSIFFTSAAVALGIENQTLMGVIFGASLIASAAASLFDLAIGLARKGKNKKG